VTHASRRWPEPPAIHPLGRRRQANKLGGLKVLEERGITRRLSVVKLIDDHHLKSFGIDRLYVLAPQRLDHREQMAAVPRAVTATENLAEARVLQRRPERRAALVEDLFSMSDK
jgi:hypothetical protein